MGIQKVDVGIKGVYAILMHRFPLEPVLAIEKKTPEEQCEIAAYRTTKGELFIPGVNLQRAFIAGATFSKGKGRATLQKPVAACVFVTPEHLILDPQEYNIDSRAVVVPATKGRIVRHRPRVEEGWTLEFTLEFDDALLMEKQLRTVIDDTGSLVGIGDFRPEKKGPFGRFMVTKWETCKKKGK